MTCVLSINLTLTRPKGINKMSALVAKLKRNSFYGKMIEDLYRHEGTKFTREEERVVEKALKSLFMK